MQDVNIRPAAVAGAFYPGDTDTLSKMIDDMLAEVRPADLPAAPKALIVPHAGYIYSGPIAASAYALLKPLRETTKRIVLLGPVHRVPVRGLALPDADAFTTPLGNVLLDKDAMQDISGLTQVVISDAAHAWEHSLEVHLPFLQKVIGDFRLVPLAVGDASPEEVSEVLEHLWGGEETLIVISSDLSHYQPYDEAQLMDEATVQNILDLTYPSQHDQACGATPINGLLHLSRKKGLQPHLLDLRNSGDTAGDKGQVVGYAAFAFTEDSDD